MFYGVKSVSLYWFTMSLPGQISLPLSIYNIFTGSNRYPSLRFTRFLEGQTSFISSFYKVFTGSKQSPFIDLQEFYRFKPVSLFWFTMFLQGQISLFFFDLQGFYGAQSMSWFTWCLHVIYMLLEKRFPSEGRWLYLFFTVILNGEVKTENWRKFYFTTPMM